MVFASNILVPLLAMCFTSFISHGFLSESMLSVMLVPVIKDKAGKISSKDNYRPIALASVVPTDNVINARYCNNCPIM